MCAKVIAVPELVRQKAAAQGAVGTRWLAALGQVLDDLAGEWELVIGATVPGGSDAYVAEVTLNDGSRAILKLALAGSGTSHQIETLLLAGGCGYVRLLRHDVGRQAMLQERLGVSLAELGLPVATQLEIICAVLRRAWAVAPDPRFTSGGEKALALAEFIAGTWEQLGRPCSERVIERALAFARAREAAFVAESAVLVHGDAHADNTLLARAEPEASGARFKFVDPDGLFAEPACDLAVLMREWSGDLLEGDTVRLGRDRCARLSRLTSVETQPIWEWGFIERVSTGLLALQVGREALGRDMLAVAEKFAAV